MREAEYRMSASPWNVCHEDSEPTCLSCQSLRPNQFLLTDRQRQAFHCLMSSTVGRGDTHTHIFVWSHTITKDSCSRSMWNLWANWTSKYHLITSPPIGTEKNLCGKCEKLPPVTLNTHRMSWVIFDKQNQCSWWIICRNNNRRISIYFDSLQNCPFSFGVTPGDTSKHHLWYTSHCLRTTDLANEYTHGCHWSDTSAETQLHTYYSASRWDKYT